MGTRTLCYVDENALAMKGLCKRTGCMYRSRSGLCDYRMFTGTGRGCPVGNGCDKYKKGSRPVMKKSVWSAWNEQ